MKTRYSPSTGTSYPFNIDYGDRLPVDLIEVSQDDYDAAMTARALGYSADFIGGQLAITPAAPVPFTDLAAPYMATVRATREAILNRLAGIGLASLVADDTATVAAVATARVALLNITDDPRVAAAADIDSLKSAVLLAYRDIVASLPDDLKNAFNEVNN